VEEENFAPPAPIVEELQEIEDTPEEQASRSFVTIFYSLLHSLQNSNSEEQYQQRKGKMFGFFHPEAWITVQV
jgi:hypothetical protein